MCDHLTLDAVSQSTGLGGDLKSETTFGFIHSQTQTSSGEEV